MKTLHSQLDNQTFYRCHNSHVINLNKITKLGKGRGGYIVLENEDVVPVSNSKLSTLIQIIGI